MANRIPVDLDVEYRGVAPESQFVNRDSGELVQVAPKLKFEAETLDGDVEMLVVSATRLDQAQGSLDYKTFKRGERFRLFGLAVIQDKSSKSGSYLAVLRMDRVSGNSGAKSASAAA